MYQPLAQNPPYGLVAITFLGAADPAALLPAVRATVQSVAPDLPMYQITLMRDLSARYLATERLTLAIAGGFSGMTLLLCAMGLYGALAQGVAERRREIGVRMALGATRAGLRQQVVGAGIRLILAGLLAGTGGILSTIAARVLTHLVPGVVSPTIWTIGADALLLVAVAVAASWVPALRASAVDPIVVLRID
jgi:putative ABC transport system permease protein